MYSRTTFRLWRSLCLAALLSASAHTALAATATTSTELANKALESMTSCTAAEHDAWNNANGWLINKFVFYPPQAKTEKREGMTSVSMSIGADGSVKAASIAVSSGYTDLDAVALTAVKLTKFSPLVCAGSQRPHRTSQTVTFKLDKPLPLATSAPRSSSRIAASTAISDDTLELIRLFRTLDNRSTFSDVDRARMATGITQMFPNLAPATLIQALSDIEKGYAEAITAKGGWNDQMAAYFQSKFKPEEIKTLVRILSSQDNQAVFMKLISGMTDMQAINAAWGESVITGLRGTIIQSLRVDSSLRNIKSESLGLEPPNQTK